VPTPLIIGIAALFFSVGGMTGIDKVSDWMWVILACVDGAVAALFFLRLVMLRVGRQAPCRHPVVMACLGMAFVMVFVIGVPGAYGVAGFQLVVFLNVITALGEFAFGKRRPPVRRPRANSTVIVLPRRR
jgi:hypothetical protein